MATSGGSSESNRWRNDGQFLARLLGHAAGRIALSHGRGGVAVDVFRIEVAAGVRIDDGDEFRVGNPLLDRAVVDTEHGGVGLGMIVAVVLAALVAAVVPQRRIGPTAAVRGVQIVALVAAIGQPLGRPLGSSLVVVQPRPAEVLAVRSATARTG